MVVPPSEPLPSPDELTQRAALVGVEFSALQPWFGATVRGSDLHSSSTTATQAQLLVDALYVFGLLHFPSDEPLSPANQVAFATLFDHEPANLHEGHPVQTITRLDHHPCVVVQGHDRITNHHGISDKQLTPFPTKRHMWHTDGIWQLQCPPMLGAMHCIAAPETGGHTRFICGHRAFELLPPDLRQRCLRMRVRYDSMMNEQIVAAKKDDPVTWPEHCNDVAIDHIDEGREDNDERGDEYGGGA